MEADPSASLPNPSPPAPPTIPVVWTIAGTDPSGGAGIQADLKTMHALGVHGGSVITAVVAQNTQGVAAIEPVSPAMIHAQLDALRRDLPPTAIKLGMLTHAHTLQSVGMLLRDLEAFVVCDPVLKSSGGVDLLEPAAMRSFREELLPHVHLLTPNRPEAEALLDRPVLSSADMEEAAADLLKLGPRSVLLKGGHGQGRFAQDFWTNGRERAWLTLPRLDTTSTHGTGCVLSSAIAAGVARGYAELDAIVIARAYLNQGLRTAPGLGHGRGPLGFGGWPRSPEDLPWITPTARAGMKTYFFPPMEDPPIGLYPIVDRVEGLKRLAPLGVRTIQLRIKDLQGAALEKEIRDGIAYARGHGCRLFINDQWRLAAECAAYGVHLGQDDLATADLDAIAAAGLRLGISTHGYHEMARALACRPSYIALGTVFESPSKAGRQHPLGLDGFARLRPLSAVPVVAIGGITLERAADVRRAGADGLAVISDLHRSSDLADRVAAWKAFWMSPG
jgi:hydroxymethylpyrimidine kinase/phosphomethylpyrimidine kinase/thiamine-phosphate diphosphorylase